MPTDATDRRSNSSSLFLTLLRGPLASAFCFVFNMATPITLVESFAVEKANIHNHE